MVAALSTLSVIVAVWGTRTGSNPTHSRVDFSTSSFSFFEPWSFLRRARRHRDGDRGARFPPRRRGAAHRAHRRVRRADPRGRRSPARCVHGVPSARGGAAPAGLVLATFLWWRWFVGLRAAAGEARQQSRRSMGRGAARRGDSRRFRCRHGRDERRACDRLDPSLGRVRRGGDSDPRRRRRFLCVAERSAKCPPGLDEQLAVRDRKARPEGGNLGRSVSRSYPSHPTSGTLNSDDAYTWNW